MIGLRDEHDAPAPTPPPSRAPALTARLFADGGWLAEGLSLEHRPQQEAMARAVAAALRDDEPLLFEAGTGVGKSLAYLLPGIIHAVDQTRQLLVVVSAVGVALADERRADEVAELFRLAVVRRTLASRWAWLRDSPGPLPDHLERPGARSRGAGHAMRRPKVPPRG